MHAQSTYVFVCTHIHEPSCASKKKKPLCKPSGSCSSSVCLGGCQIARVVISTDFVSFPGMLSPPLHSEAERDFLKCDISVGGI